MSKENQLSTADHEVHVADLQQIVAKLVRAKMKHSKTNLRTLEKELSITGMSHWINGRRSYSLKRIVKICNHFDIPIGMGIQNQNYQLSV